MRLLRNYIYVMIKMSKKKSSIGQKFLTFLRKILGGHSLTKGPPTIKHTRTIMGFAQFIAMMLQFNVNYLVLVNSLLVQFLLSRVLSSVVERMHDTHEAEGSIPPGRTKAREGVCSFLQRSPPADSGRAGIRLRRIV